MNLDPNTSDRESHKDVDAEPGSRVISVLSFLKAENIKLRQAVVELNRMSSVLKEAQSIEGKQTSAERLAYMAHMLVRSARGTGGINYPEVRRILEGRLTGDAVSLILRADRNEQPPDAK